MSEAQKREKLIKCLKLLIKEMDEEQKGVFYSDLEEALTQNCGKSQTQRG
jgi:hypothetical protein